MSPSFLQFGMRARRISLQGTIVPLDIVSRRTSKVHENFADTRAVDEGVNREDVHCSDLYVQLNESQTATDCF